MTTMPPPPRVIAIDTETTSFRPCHIVEFAAVDTTTLRSFQRRVKPGVRISFSASKVHGIRDVDVAGAPDFGSAWRDFVLWVEALDDPSPTVVLLTHNGFRFDFPVISDDLARFGLELPAHWRMADLLPHVRGSKGYSRAFPGAKEDGACALGKLYEREFGRPLDGAHAALADTMALAELYRRATVGAPGFELKLRGREEFVSGGSAQMGPRKARAVPAGADLRMQEGVGKPSPGEALDAETDADSDSESDDAGVEAGGAGGGTMSPAACASSGVAILGADLAALSLAGSAGIAKASDVSTVPKPIRVAQGTTVSASAGTPHKWPGVPVGLTQTPASAPRAEPLHLNPSQRQAATQAGSGSSTAAPPPAKPEIRLSPASPLTAVRGIGPTYLGRLCTSLGLRERATLGDLCDALRSPRFGGGEPALVRAFLTGADVGMFRDEYIESVMQAITVQLQVQGLATPPAAAAAGLGAGEPSLVPPADSDAAAAGAMGTSLTRASLERRE